MPLTLIPATGFKKLNAPKALTVNEGLTSVTIHYTVMRFLDLKETSTEMAADWIFEKFKLI